MVTDARAQADLIARLHLEALFKLGHLESACGQSNGITNIEPVFPHTRTHNSVQLRDRLAFIRRLALHAQGLTIQIDMAKAATKQVHVPDSSLGPAEVAA